MKITKQDIGKTFWAFPTGNNFLRTGTNHCKPIIIEDMKRKKGVFRFEDSQYSIDFSNSDWKTKDFIHIKAGFNGGYHLFDSFESYTLWRKKQEAISFISSLFRYSSDSKHLSSETVIEAATLLGWEDK